MTKVVIADDSQTARMFIRRCLEIAGLRDAQFIEVEGGEDALQQLPADLLFTDLTMKGMDGTELLRRVRANADWRAMRIFVITSAKNPAKEKELLELGAAAVLGKPISPAGMAQALRDAEAKAGAR